MQGGGRAGVHGGRHARLWVCEVVGMHVHVHEGGQAYEAAGMQGGGYEVSSDPTMTRRTCTFIKVSQT